MHPSVNSEVQVSIHGSNIQIAANAKRNLCGTSCELIRVSLNIAIINFSFHAIRAW